MKIDVILTAEEAKYREIDNTNILVIDVLRATSVMVTAMSYGIHKIFPYETIEDVWKASANSSFAIRCGERKGLKIKSFDYGNSPWEFMNSNLQGKEMFMTTTNGTRSLQNIRGQNNRIWIASFLNLNSMIKFLEQEEKDCIFLCAGTENHFSLDDALCAGMIIQNLSKYEKTDIAMCLEKLASTKGNLHEKLKGTKHYEYLKRIGLEKDLEYCLSLNLYDIVLEYLPKENYIRKK